MMSEGVCVHASACPNVLMSDPHFLEVGNCFLDVHDCRWLQGQTEDSLWLPQVQFLSLQHRVFDAAAL